MSALTVVQKAMAAGVPADRDEADALGRLAVEVNARIKDIRDQRMATTRKLDAAKADLIALEREQTAPLIDAKKYIDELLLEWNAQESQRVEAERQEQEERVAALESAAIRAVEDGRFDDAGTAMAEVDEFVAEPRAYRPAGTSVTTHWKAEVVDWKAFLQWVIETERYDLVSAVSLHKVAQQRKQEGTFNGMRMYAVRGVAATGRV